MALALRPINRLSLRLECPERAAGMIFDNEIRNRGPFAIALRAGLNVDVRQFCSPKFAHKAALHIGRWPAGGARVRALTRPSGGKTYVARRVVSV